ncbi:Gfo/Idh/MocA family oxidoreductase [Patescibacteria group bacterium]|nr:Gfo/Idh/MocA family oxidoreductase [Patescibacteria group bacterium]MBU4367591.1 Gfo/Idh/MocA family oxidoreductase [Patescibacteria group bacterium]MBU4461631.1 Gfo/Idh/MocA family oxidoreductase [Patescibacteria group bacterium]MCG2699529.1 Gfo/Idh/MocA family oxidoreductase [Candidatus Parcubacteria bacterium]
MKKKILKVGVIGIGNMGRHHARIYSQLIGVSLKAVADISATAGRVIAKRYNCKFYQSYKKMLAEEKLNAVSIAVPTHLHKKVALDCINQGVSVFIEKPISMTLGDAQQIIQAARKQKVTLAVGHVERFNPAVQKLKDFIKQGKFGKITSIWIKRVGLFPPQAKNANVITDLAVHDIDVCNYLLAQKPKRVYAKAGKALNSRRLDYASIFLDYGAVDVSIQVNWITPIKIRKLSITGTKGYAELDYINQHFKMYENNYQKGFDSYGDFIIKFGTPKVERIKIKTEEPLKLELQNFSDYLQSRKGIIVSGKEALVNLEVALRAIESHKTARIMDVKT